MKQLSIQLMSRVVDARVTIMGLLLSLVILFAAFSMLWKYQSTVHDSQETHTLTAEK